MGNYTNDELIDVVQFLESTIMKCEKMKGKFAVGTSQHSLLVNRVKALQIAKCLIEDSKEKEEYTLEDLEKALPPVISIINKTSKAQSKNQEGTSQYRRYLPILKAMHVSQEYIENEISERKNR